jgi:hypothetical protein
MTKVHVVSDFGLSLPADSICAINMISETKVDSNQYFTKHFVNSCKADHQHTNSHKLTMVPLLLQLTTLQVCKTFNLTSWLCPVSPLLLEIPVTLEQNPAECVLVG